MGGGVVISERFERGDGGRGCHSRGEVSDVIDLHIPGTRYLGRAYFGMGNVAWCQKGGFENMRYQKGFLII